ncbi:MAG: MarR family winged helix-turn-helix transcriptional regulator [Pseudomonadota bacterium]
MTEMLRIEIWGRLLQVSETLRAGLEGDLKAAGLPPLDWYATLLALARAGPSRPFELRRQVTLPQYTLSRLIDRLERAGHVSRAPCPEDGRGQIVSATDQGLELLDEMWPVYRAAIIARISGELSEDEIATLASLLEKLVPGEVQLIP